MEDQYLYQQIAESIRQEILTGRLEAGDRLPSVRELAAQWNCTLGTAQRAYHELAEQHLVVSRPGRGTQVADKSSLAADTALRRANLVHRAEAFLLEALTAGFEAQEVESAVRQALDRWRVLEREPDRPAEHTLRFSGSHDLAVAWLAARFGEFTDGGRLELAFTGSLGGLIALAEGHADLAGAHLWDKESGEYNAPYVRRFLPNERVALLTLAHRRLGLLVAPGNPLSIESLDDLARPEVRFVNRQAGSGTRVWLDYALQSIGIAPTQIDGYDEEKMTHLEIARAIAEGRADAGLGLETAALAYGLAFVELRRERYDLVIPEVTLDRPQIQALRAWLELEETKQAIAALGGYDTGECGNLVWVE